MSEGVFIRPKVFRPVPLSIGHPCRPSAFNRVNTNNMYNIGVGQLTLSDMPNHFVRNIDYNKLIQQHQEIFSYPFYEDSKEASSSSTFQTPEFKPLNCRVPSFGGSDEKCNKNEVSEFLQNLQAPATKKARKTELLHKANEDIREEMDKDDLSPGNSKFCTVDTYASEQSYSSPSLFKFYQIGQSQIGHYTKEERQEKIRRFKQKKLIWLQGKNKNRNRYMKRRLIAKNKPRVGGKFVKKATDL